MNTITTVLCITSAFLSSDAMTDPNLSMGTSVEKDCLPVMEWQNSKDDIFLTQHNSYLEVDKLIQSKQNRYGESNLSDSDSTLQSMGKKI